MTCSEAINLSGIFAYPEADYLSRLEALAKQLSLALPLVSEHLRRLTAALQPMQPEAIAELFSSTFDLAPACAPYLSVHLFGEGSYKRASLMTGLMEAYTKAGVSCHGELPDHLCVVLRALESLDTELQVDLLSFCIGPALTKMEAELGRQDNPYRHAILAVQAWLTQLQNRREVKCA